jgi:hypothetical protein
MNLLPGTIGSDGALHAEQLAIPLPSHLRSRLSAGSGVTLGVHAEDAVVYDPAKPASDGVRIKGTVEMVEPDFGRRQALVFMTAGESRFTLVCPIDAGWRAGEEIEAILPEERLYFFDSDTGARLR